MVYMVVNTTTLYSVRGLERSELGGSHGCPGGRGAFGTDFYDEYNVVLGPDSSSLSLGDTDKRSKEK